MSGILVKERRVVQIALESANRTDRIAGVALTISCAASLVVAFLIAGGTISLSVAGEEGSEPVILSPSIWLLAGLASGVGMLSGIQILQSKWWGYGLAALSCVTLILVTLPVIGNEPLWALGLIPPVIFAGYLSRRFWQIAASRRS